MRKFVVLLALSAGMMLFATPDSAKADHRSHSGGYGYGPGYGSYGPGYGGYGGGYGGLYSSPYGRGSHRCYDGSFGSRFIDPYHGIRPRSYGYGHDQYDFQLRTGRFGFYYGR